MKDTHHRLSAQTISFFVLLPYLLNRLDSIFINYAHCCMASVKDHSMYGYPQFMMGDLKMSIKVYRLGKGLYLK